MYCVCMCLKLLCKVCMIVRWFVLESLKIIVGRSLSKPDMFPVSGCLMGGRFKHFV